MSGPRRAAVALLVSAAVALVFPSCGPKTPPAKAELVCRLLPPDGRTAVTERELRDTAGLLDLELGRAGFERREVLPMGDGRIRIVLPQAQIARMPEVREIVANPRLRLRPE